MSYPLRFVSSRSSVAPFAVTRLPWLAALSVLAFAPGLAAHAAAIDESIPTPQLLVQLEQRASQAVPREQAFLYTELVHTMTEKAGQEIADGDAEAAAASLQKINAYARLIHVNLASDTRRLKNAELLMHHTTFRLGEYLRLVSGDDKLSVEATLKQLDAINDELLVQVFRH